MRNRRSPNPQRRRRGYWQRHSFRGSRRNRWASEPPTQKGDRWPEKATCPFSWPSCRVTSCLPHQARSSDRPSPVRLRRHLSRHRLHHRTKGDSENLGSSRKKKKKKRLAPATRALATGFTPRHLSEYPDTRTAGVFLQHPTPPAGDTSQPPCPGCLSFATLTTTHSDCTAPFWWGKFADRRSGAYEFSYPLSFLSFPILYPCLSVRPGRQWGTVPVVQLVRRLSVRSGRQWETVPIIHLVRRRAKRNRS